ncbi:MAG: FAD-dependent oxidoreductase [Oligoflexia bacterium]|nr:FAD-dependent oxidoreductase [Oligoflexia bacterium]
MSLVNLYREEARSFEAQLHPLRQTRAGIIDALNSKRPFDVLIIGGGIHGAMFARLAALGGLRTALLERSDYAAETSSRSSRMIHGGLRYLELGDFGQVFEGLRAREMLLHDAHHLVKPQQFLLPILPSGGLSRFKAGAGLAFYDLLLHDRKRRHRWLTASELPKELQPLVSRGATGGYCFFDALANDARLVMENILAARQEGALCLNHASVESVRTFEHMPAEIGWLDRLSGKSHELRAGTVINCTGPWVPYTARLRPSELRQRVRYSRGVHLIFDFKWEGPALLRPAREKGQHYFIWPHPLGTMVGPTDDEIDEPQSNPAPTQTEIAALLARVQEDFGAERFNLSRIRSAFAGIRTLPVRGSGGRTAELSRRHLWVHHGGMLNLLGGKLTTSVWTVEQGYQLMLKLAGRPKSSLTLRNRKLPGSAYYLEAVGQFNTAALAKGAPAAVIEAAVARLGSRVRILSELDPELRTLSGFFSAELMLSVLEEQAESWADLMLRRLQNPLADLEPQALKLLNDLRPEGNWLR